MGWDIFWRGKKEGSVFTMQIASSFYVGCRGLMKDYLTVLDQEIPGWLIKITFLGKAETQLDQVLNLDLASWAFSMTDTILGLWFSLEYFKHRI